MTGAASTREIAVETPSEIALRAFRAILDAEDDW
jgi:hypothetical protein